MGASDGPKSNDLEGVFYTAVGFAVLGFQRLQVARRDVPGELRSLARWLDRQLDAEPPDRATDR